MNKETKAQIIVNAGIMVNPDGSQCTVDDVLRNDAQSAKSMINAYWIIANNVLAARGAR